MSAKKVHIVTTNYAEEVGSGTDKFGCAYYVYQDDPSNQEPTLPDPYQDRHVDRFVRIGICIQCFNAGPVGLECKYCEVAEIRREWYAALKTESGTPINPLSLQRACTKNLMKPRRRLLRLSFGPDASPCGPFGFYDQSYCRIWNDEIRGRYNTILKARLDKDPPYDPVYPDGRPIIWRPRVTAATAAA